MKIPIRFNKSVLCVKDEVRAHISAMRQDAQRLRQVISNRNEFCDGDPTCLLMKSIKVWDTRNVFFHAHSLSRVSQNLKGDLSGHQKMLATKTMHNWPLK